MTRYFLLMLDGSRMVKVSEAYNPNELIEFAREAHVTGIVVEEYITVDFSGERNIFHEHPVAKALKNLISKGKT